MSHIIGDIIDLTMAQVNRDLILIINELADSVGNVIIDPFFFLLFFLPFLIIQIVRTLWFTIAIIIII